METKGIIKPEIKYTKQWRMCTDFTDLNMACLKDAYPLSIIDQ